MAEDTNSSQLRANRQIRRSQTLANLQTRIPYPMHAWLKSYAALSGMTLADLHDDLFAHYLSQKPWHRPGWVWRQPQSVVSRIDGMDSRVGEWQQHNIQLSETYADILRAEAEKAGVSLATFLFSGIFWATLTLYRPK
jgi:hypothetical protein